MGVRHLQTFMQEQVPKGVINIRIKDEIEKYKRLNNNESPAIIIDLLGFTQFIWTNEKEILLGGRYNIYNERLEKLFQSLSELGAHFYFVNDGPTMPEKLPTMLKRRNNNYKNYCQIIEAIENGVLQLNNKNLSKEYCIGNLTPYFANIRSIAKKYFQILTSVREGDQDMVYWANEKKAMAIMSSDTDFLIFEGDWKLWSANDFNPHELTTKEFNKSALRKHLSLSDRQLVLLATLASNDFVDYEMIVHFHRRIRATRYEKFHLLAKIVRNTKSLAPNFQRDEVSNLINMMFKPEDRNDGLKTFWQSVHFYLDAKEAPPCLPENAIFLYSPFIWTILNDIPCFVNLFYFDIKENNGFTNFYYLVRKLIQKQIGVILRGSKQDLSSISRKIYIKTEHEREYYGIDEIPIYPDYDTPSLLKLCLTPMGDDQNLDNLRKKLLCWFVSSNILNVNILDELPQDLVILITIIVYLLENKQIDIDEADCLLFSSIPSSLNEELCLNQFEKISNIRNFRLSFLFQRLYSILSRCVKILGLHSYKATLNFDGLVFHYLRTNEGHLINFRREFDNLRVYKNY